MDEYDLLFRGSIGLLVVAGILWFLKMLFFPRSPGLDTLDGYLEKHPKCLKNGRVHCRRCGSGSIYLYRWAYGPGWLQNLHVCRQCGAKLYQSTIVT